MGSPAPFHTFRLMKQAPVARWNGVLTAELLLGSGMMRVAADGALVRAGNLPGARFAVAKFRPPPLPSTLVARSALHDQLTTGAGQRLTLVAGSAGAGKSVLLSSWMAARPAGLTFWLS